MDTIKREARIVMPVLEEPNSGKSFLVHRSLRTKLCGVFGGCTVTSAAGSWVGPDGDAVEEDVLVYDVAILPSQNAELARIAVERRRHHRRGQVRRGAGARRGDHGRGAEAEAEAEGQAPRRRRGRRPVAHTRRVYRRPCVGSFHERESFAATPRGDGHGSWHVLPLHLPRRCPLREVQPRERRSCSRPR